MKTCFFVPIDEIFGLDAKAKKKVHIKACGYSLKAWESFVNQGKKLSYRDSLLLMKHTIDIELPKKALEAVIKNVPNNEISKSYLEPITALQDMDWQPPENIEYAYYTIYNLYNKYCENKDIDDWLIINQSLSSTINEKEALALFQEVLLDVRN